MKSIGILISLAWTIMGVPLIANATPPLTEVRASSIHRSSPLIINEFVASNSRSLDDGDGNSNDWIEIYNRWNDPISMQGWSLTDRANNLTKWSFPSGVVIQGGDYLIVFASGQDGDPYQDAAGYLHTNFALRKNGEYLALVMPDGQVAHDYSPSYPAQETDISYGLWDSQERYFLEPTPGYPNASPVLGLISPTVHSQGRGFYDAPFNLALTCAIPDVVIRYTLDGSEPTSEHGIVYSNQPIWISTTTQVRSIATKTDWATPDVTTHTYLFLDDVAQQPADPVGWPSDWGFSSDAGAIVPADYEMDTRVVDNTLPDYSIRDALLDIPTMSISMESDDFISDDLGIYANPESRWERKCALEYWEPNSNDEFQVDCKIEVHGNASRRPYRMQKHSLRLTFTSEYGPSKLNFPLFANSDVNEFNQLVLRACFTDSWGLVSWSSSTRYRPNDSQYTRDVWMKDSLADMGQPSSCGRYVHLYINGLYFGLFNLTERVSDDFFADHLGGEPEDWEINEDLSSPGPTWNSMIAINPATPIGYEAIQDYLDVENFADYMLLHFYADAEDWPHHNGYAAANIVSGDGKFRFFVWDQEIVLDYHGRAASRINNNSGAGALFQLLRSNPEFRLLFADRVYQHCFHDGALSVTASQVRYARIANEIDKAIVAESARWGDTQMSTPYGNAIEQPQNWNNINDNLYPPAPHGPDYYFTREDSWVLERDNILYNYLPAIADTNNSYALLNVLRNADLYPDIDPARMYINGFLQHGGTAQANDLLLFWHPSPTAEIYYTLDGTDPRLPDTSGQVTGTPLVDEDADKSVWIPMSNIGLTWTGRSEPFDDSSWTDGIPAQSTLPAGVGYERSSGYESLISYDVETGMYGQNQSCYIRIPFHITELQDTWNKLTLQMRYDDGFVAYLNGTLIAQANAPTSPQWNSGATTTHSDSAAVVLQEFDCTDFLGLLQPDNNLLAIHGLNSGLNSSDFLISAALNASEDSRDGELSPAAHLYTGPIILTEDTCVNLRVWDQGQWSALSQAEFKID